MTSRPVLAIILNWNSASYLPRCLEHVRSQDGVDVRVLVVDNGSTDESLQILTDLSSSEVLRLDTNRGFAEGMNAGLRIALADDVEFSWLLNTDAFPEPGCLASLLAGMQSNPALGMTAPRLISTDGTEQHAGGRVDWRDGHHDLLRAEDLVHPAHDGCWLSGTAPLIRTSSLRRAGLFEPSFFAYWEDVDLSIRLTRTGSSLAAIPDAVTTHVGNASTGTGSPFVEFLLTRNTWLFLKRNAPGGSSWARWCRYVARAFERAAMMDARGERPEVSAAVLAGVSAARAGRFGVPSSINRPDMFERLCFRHPWRFSAVLGHAANLIEP